MNNNEFEEDDTLQIDPLFLPVLVSPNKMRFYSGPISGPEYTVRDDDEEGVFDQIIELLVDGSTPKEIFDTVESIDKDSVLELIVGLYDSGILIEDASESTGLESTRGYISQLTISNEFEVDNLNETSVLVCSAGVDTSLLQNQLTQTDIGSVSHDRLNDATDPDLTNLTSSDELRSFDAVILLTRRSDGKIGTELTQRTRTAGVPLITGRVNGLDAFIGPVIMPKGSPCYNCFQIRLESNILTDENYSEYINESPRFDRGPMINIFEDFVASHLSITTIRLLSTGASFLTGAAVHIDFLTTNMTRNDILPVPQCSVCGTNRNQVPEQQPFISVNQLQQLDDQ